MPSHRARMTSEFLRAFLINCGEIDEQGYGPKTRAKKRNHLRHRMRSGAQESEESGSCVHAARLALRRHGPLHRTMPRTIRRKGMLILTRKVGETTMIGDAVTVTVMGVKGQTSTPRPALPSIGKRSTSASSANEATQKNQRMTCRPFACQSTSFTGTIASRGSLSGGLAIVPARTARCAKTPPTGARR
jgi:hypothetical protein